VETRTLDVKEFASAPQGLVPSVLLGGNLPNALLSRDEFAGVLKQALTVAREDEQQRMKSFAEMPMVDVRALPSAPVKNVSIAPPPPNPEEMFPPESLDTLSGEAMDESITVRKRLFLFL